MQAVTVRDGVSLRVETFGSGAPLVLIPGLGGSMRVWGPFPRAMGAHFMTVAYDPRGFGGSVAQPCSITMGSMVSDLADILDSLRIAKAHLFGVSMGGVVAQQFAARHPDRTDRIVLVSTTGRMTRWSGRVLDMFETLARRLEPSEWAAAMATLSLSPKYFENPMNRPGEFERGLTPAQGERDGILAQIAALRSLSDAGRTTGPAAPALVIGGRTDAITPLSASADLARSIPGARLKELDGGHACLVERTDEGLVEILSFLKK
jgi:pimeloyl-ACP methyl ester carboxylesterase